MDSAYSLVLHDRAFITHAARPSTLEFAVNFAGSELDMNGRVVAPSAAANLVRKALTKGFAESGTTHLTIQSVAREVHSLIARDLDEGLGPHGASQLAVTAKESELVSVRYTAALKPDAAEAPTWTVAVRNQIRAAHSFTGEQFGPCQNHHGITWVVTVEFSSKGDELHPCFANHGSMEDLVKTVCHRFDLQDMDTHPDFAAASGGGSAPPVNTTCEVMCRAVWQQLAAALLHAGGGSPGDGGNEKKKKGGGSPTSPPVDLRRWAEELVEAQGSVKVVVHESDEAFVEFEQSLEAAQSELKVKQAKKQVASAKVSAEATMAAAAAAAAQAAESSALASASSPKKGGDEKLLELLHATLNERNIGAENLREVQGMAKSLAAAAAEETKAVERAREAVKAAEVSAASSAADARFRVAVRGRAMAARTLHDVRHNGGGGGGGDEEGSASGGGDDSSSSSGGGGGGSGRKGKGKGTGGAVHGNTFVVDAVFEGRELQELPGYMIDICLLADLVRDTLGFIHNQSLDDPAIASMFFGGCSGGGGGAGPGGGALVAAAGGGGGGGEGVVVAPTSEAVAGALWRALITALPPLERSQTTHLRVIVSDGLFGRAEFAAPLWPDAGGDFLVYPDPYFHTQRALLPPSPPPTAPPSPPPPSPSTAVAAVAGGGDSDTLLRGRTPVFLVDLDGCLFYEPLLHAGGVWPNGGGAIAKAVHAHCGKEYGLSPQACDALHRQHGDTTVGLQRIGRLGTAAPLAPLVGDDEEGEDEEEKGSTKSPSSASSTVGVVGSTLDDRVLMSIWEAADGFRGTYAQVVEHEKEIGLSGSSGDLGGKTPIGGDDKQNGEDGGGGGEGGGGLLRSEVEGAVRYYKGVFESAGVQKVVRAMIRRRAQENGDHDEDDDDGDGECGGSSLSSVSSSLSTLKDLLGALPFPKLVASNSPKSSYVEPVLDSLGLGVEEVGWHGVLTPQDYLKLDETTPKKLNNNNGNCSGGGGGNGNGRLVTKAHVEFWAPLFKRFPPDKYQLVLFDDSSHNLEVAERCGITPYLVHHEKRPLRDALLEALSCLLPGSPPPPHVQPPLTSPSSSSSSSSSSFVSPLTSPLPMGAVVSVNQPHTVWGGGPVVQGVVLAGGDVAAESGAAYLDAKKVVDDAALNQEVRQALVGALAERCCTRLEGKQGEEEVVLRVVDLGAGHLTMLSRVCELAAEAGFKAQVDYVAVEPQKGLANVGLRRLEQEHGFVAVLEKERQQQQQQQERRSGGGSGAGVSSAAAAGGGGGRVLWYSGSLGGVEHVRVATVGGDATKMREADLTAVFASPSGSGTTSSSVGVDLCVGCSFADLIDPSTLAATVLALAPGALLYLPLTFAGRSQFSVHDAGTTAARPNEQQQQQQAAASNVTPPALPRWAQSGRGSPTGSPASSSSTATEHRKSNRSGGNGNAAGLRPVFAPGHFDNDAAGDGRGSDRRKKMAGRVPPDFVCEALYHEHLTKVERQFIGVDALLTALTAGNSISSSSTGTTSSAAKQNRAASSSSKSQKSGGVLSGGGLTLLACGSSDWVVDPSDEQQKPMWNAMLRFLGRALPAQLLRRGYSPTQWVRAKLTCEEVGVGPDGAVLRPSTATTTSSSSSNKSSVVTGDGQQEAVVAAWAGVLPSVVVGNVDLLLSIPSTASWRLPDYECMVMTGPRTVEVQSRSRCRQTPDGDAALPAAAATAGDNGESLGPGKGQVEVASVVSMISNGTELKFYRGDFESDGGDDGEGLDATISGLAEQRMAYPLEYGYSLVGRPVSVGAGVDAKTFLGGGSDSGRDSESDSSDSGLVFAFHPHASSVVLDSSCLMPVPAGICAADAVFLPAVETALSIAHDAHPRLGESVAVFGQGLIGALVTAVLSRVGGVHVVAFDGRSDRRKLARRCGARAALPPPSSSSPSSPSSSSSSAAGSHAPHGGQGFDVCVEVSGNPAALQGAVDACRKGGKVVVASWYGHAANLNLGTKFHRSHISIVASQVSEMCGAVSGTWTKERRFAAAWDLVRRLKPSTLLTPRLVTPLREIGAAYRALDSGDAVACLVTYGNGESPLKGSAAEEDATEEGSV